MGGRRATRRAGKHDGPQTPAGSIDEQRELGSSSDDEPAPQVVRRRSGGSKPQDQETPAPAPDKVRQASRKTPKKPTAATGERTTSVARRREPRKTAVGPGSDRRPATEASRTAAPDPEQAAITPAAAEEPTAAPADTELPTGRSAWAAARAQVAAYKHHSVRRRPSLLPVIGVGVLLVGVAFLAARGRPGARPIASESARTAGPTAQVAAAISVNETFDELPMDSALPPPWAVTGDGGAKIVALPTSVDRSIRIASATGGTATSACYPVDLAAGSLLRVAFTYRLGPTIPSPVPILSLRARDSSVAGLIIDTAAAPMAISGASGAIWSASAEPNPTVGGVGVTPLSPADWRRLVAQIEPGTGAVAWRVSDEAGAEIGDLTATVATLPDQAISALCLLSPEASPSGWLAVDDLIIEG